jgi:hypothetical protein
MRKPGRLLVHAEPRKDIHHYAELAAAGGFTGQAAASTIARRQSRRAIGRSDVAEIYYDKTTGYRLGRDGDMISPGRFAGRMCAN